METRHSLSRLLIVGIVIILLQVACTTSSKLPEASTPTKIVTKEEVSTSTPTVTPSLVPTATNTATPPPTATPLPKANVIGEIKLHSGPGLAYTVSGTAAEGDSVTVMSLNTDSTWLEIQTGSITGWVAAEEVTPANPAVLAGLPILTDFPEPPLAIPGWKGNPILKVCLDAQPKFSGDYAGSHEGEIPDTGPIYMAAASMLVEAGLEPSSPPDCDAALLIVTDVNQTGKKYVQNGTRNTFFCYDGVNVNTTLTLEQDSNTLVKKTNKNRGSRNTLSYCAESSDYLEEAGWSVADGMYKIWGAPILPAALRSMDAPSNNFAILTIGTLGKKGLPYVPDLLDFWKTNSSFDEPIEKSLKKVTGQNLGSDVYTWVDWWLTQDPTYGTTTQSNNSQPIPSSNDSSTPGQESTPNSPQQPLSQATPVTTLDGVINGTMVGDANGQGVGIKLVGYQSYNGFEVVGEIENQMGNAIDLSKVDIEILDSAGNVLKSDSIYTSEYKIDPGKSGGFNWSYPDISNAVSIKATGVHYFEAQEYVTSFTVLSDNMVRENGAMIVSGQAKNTGQNPTKSAQVLVHFYDAAGRMIYLNYEFFSGTTIPVGGVIDFKIITDERIPIDHYMVVAECTE
jgi:hypothetical protein